MPAPQKGQLAPAVKGLFQAAGLRGEHAPDLADVVADALAKALAQFVAMAMVQPGIPGAVAPPPAPPNGATTGPGRLAAPPAGGPGASMLEPMVKGLLASKGLRGDGIDGLGKALAGAIAHGIKEFTSGVQVLPGIPVAGAVTVAPGRLA